MFIFTPPLCRNFVLLLQAISLAGNQKGDHPQLLQLAPYSNQMGLHPSLNNLIAYFDFHIALICALITRLIICTILIVWNLI